MGYKCSRCGYTSDDKICPFCDCKMYLIDTWSNVQDFDEEYDEEYEKEFGYDNED